MIEPRSYQIEAVNSIYNYFKSNSGNPVIAMPTGCHAKGHPILMHDGSIKKVEDIQIGDLLMGPDSQPRIVLNLARGRQEMRRIVPNRAESFIVNLDHKILARVTAQGLSSNGKSYPYQKSKDEIITIREYESGSKWYKHLRKLQTCAVEFPSQNLPLPNLQ